MTALAEAGLSDGNATQNIRKIPIRNLWLLMLYASDMYRDIGTRKVDVEDNPDEIANLVAEILCHQVETRLMRNLSYGYKSKVAIINRVRGQIDMLATECHRLLDKGKICCRYDELTIDTLRNRYVRAALEQLIKLNLEKKLVRKCKTLMMSLERLGVSKVKPIGYSSKSERFGRHDSGDQKMVVAADLAFSLALPTESKGQFLLTAPDSEERWLRKLFEKAIAGFYSVVSGSQRVRVSAGKKFDWKISYRSSKVDAILPSMKTDIVIDNLDSGERLIIDTKFNSIVTTGYFRENTLRSGYIYQMYAYLRSQEDFNDQSSFSSIGMLLHPSIAKEEVDERVVIQNHPIWFCTVNLGEEATAIRKRLLHILEESFNKESYYQVED